MGGLSGVFLVVVELVGGILIGGKGQKGWVMEMDSTAALLGGGALGVFVLIPWLLTGVERTEEKSAETRHGLEKKSVFSPS